MKSRYFLLVILMAAMAIGGCRKGPTASYDSNKRLKRGKPIPCPIKDC